MTDIDEKIDRLYQLPLDEFTSARNALAKDAKRADIKALDKPNIAAWAVNQLYWHQRATFDRLVKAATRLRGEHGKLLAGKSSDIREAEKDHREAIRDALDRVKQALKEGGHAATDQTLAAVQETLEALPSADAPGRLTRPLKPLGFEALAGISISPSSKPALRLVPQTRDARARTQDSRTKTAEGTPASASGPQISAKRERQLAKQREAQERERKERQREAEKALKAAEAAMLRAEEDVKKAEKTLGALRAARDEAVSEYQRARLRAHE